MIEHQSAYSGNDRMRDIINAYSILPAVTCF